MQEMLHPTAYMKGIGLGKECALLHRRPLLRWHSGLSIGHICPRQQPAESSGLSAPTGDTLDRHPQLDDLAGSR